ncbi:hypothetical protein B296_00048742, partial [Ensete ventricosum]
GEAAEEAEETASLHREAENKESACRRKKVDWKMAVVVRGSRGGRRRGQQLWSTRDATAVVAGGEEWLATVIEDESKAVTRGVRLLCQRRRKRGLLSITICCLSQQRDAISSGGAVTLVQSDTMREIEGVAADLDVVGVSGRGGRLSD